MPQTRPTDFPKLPTDLPEQNGKAYVPVDPDPAPSLSDLSPNKSNLLKDSNSSKQIKKKRNNKKNLQKHKKKDASDSPSINYDSSDDSDYIRKRHKNEKYRKKIR